MNNKKAILICVCGVIVGMLLSSILTYCNVQNVFTILMETIFG